MVPDLIKSISSWPVQREVKVRTGTKAQNLSWESPAFSFILGEKCVHSVNGEKGWIVLYKTDYLIFDLLDYMIQTWVRLSSVERLSNDLRERWREWNRESEWEKIDYSRAHSWSFLGSVSHFFTNLPRLTHIPQRDRQKGLLEPVPMSQINL